MTADEPISDAEASASDSAADAVSAEDFEPSPRGRRKRRKLADFVDNDAELSGQVDLMLGRDNPGRHKFSLRGGAISADGGPAKEVLKLVNRLAKSVEEIFPEANPFIAQLAPTNSIQVEFYAPESELREAELRRHEVGDQDPGAVGLPDTSLAVLALNAVFTPDDPDDAARTARRLGVTAAESVLNLVSTLGEAGIELDVFDADQEPVRVTPEKSIRIAAKLDAEAELPLETVEVVGVLQGVNSGGEGRFEIVTDTDIPLSPVVGRRRKAGDKIEGELSPTAKRQIKQGSLWDTHVEAKVQVTRRQRGASIRVEGFRLLSVKRRFDD